MRVFQAYSTHKDYRSRLQRVLLEHDTFRGMIQAAHDDGHNSVHTLAPVREGLETAFYTHTNNQTMQQAWARENGLPAETPLDEILLAQVEHHRSEVFYSLTTEHVDSRLARRLPSCVKAKIGFNSSPSDSQDMSEYLVLSNFPSFLEKYKRMGLRSAYFSPSHTPTLDALADNADRDIDVLFAGTYSRWHTRRAQILEAVASLNSKARVVFMLNRSRLNRLAETPLGWYGPLAKYSRPPAIREVAESSVFGLDYYRLLSRAKIVLNGHGDNGGGYGGNMRCWEAPGAGALMVTDDGKYPEGMIDGQTMRTYRTPQEAASVIEQMLENDGERRRIAQAGRTMITTRYSKERQWRDFQELVASHF